MRGASALVAASLVLLLAAAGAARQEARQEVGSEALAGPGDRPAGEAGLTPQEEAGRRIFRTGTSPSGEEILAVLAGGTELPASALPCSGCHGDDGRGNPEGGVDPTDLTWEALTRPYGVRAQGGREHGPYSPSLLKRSIAMGLDPAGNELHVAMPRYRMSMADMEALVAYMKQLGRGRRDWDPGVGRDTLTLGTLLPPPGPLDEVGQAIRAVLAAWAAEVNAGGGLYGRQVELAALELPAQAAERPAAVGAFLERERVFALVGAFLAGSEDDLPDLVAERQVPLLGPFTLHPRLEEPVNPYVFYLLPGLAAQGRALVAFAFESGRRRGFAGTAGAGEPPAEEGRAAARPAEPPVATVLHPERDPDLAAVAEAMVEEGRRRGWGGLASRTYDPEAIDVLGLASTLATIGSEAVFFLGSGTDRQLLLQAAAHYNWRPAVFAPGAMAGPEALATPAAFDGRLFFAFPTLPGDRTAAAAEAYHRLAEAHDLPRGHLATQLSTLAAARLFEEGAKRAGRDLSRAKLVAELDRLYKWDSGLLPPVTFTPNRRVGLQGAYIVALDLEARTFQRAGGWVEVE